MKGSRYKFWVLVVMILAMCADAWADVVINATNFPDATFREYVSSNFDKDSNGSLSASEIKNVTKIDVEYKVITSLKGVEHFIALKDLRCRDRQLTELDISKNTALTSLDCSYNQLIALDVSKNTALTYLNCFRSQLTALDVSKNTGLTKLDCRGNQLTKLDVSKNTALTILYCSSNQLTALDVSKNTALTNLQCGSNKLTTLDVSKNTALTELECAFNKLTTLDVSKNTALTTLYCGNQLTELDVSKNTALTVLDCGSNQLTALDVSKNTALTYLYCSSYQLTALDVSKNTKLTYLCCWNGKLTALDVSKNTALTGLNCGSNQLTALDVSKNTALTELQCYSNKLTALDVSKNTDLTYLTCDGNNLKALDVTKNTKLKKLVCWGNQLTVLNVSKSTALTELQCHSNKLTALDVSKNTALTKLSCYKNELSPIDLSDQQLSGLYCDFAVNISNDVFAFNFTAFKKAYNINWTHDSSKSSQLFHITSSTNGVEVNVDTSSGEYIMYSTMTMGGTPDNYHMSFTCLRKSGSKINVSVHPASNPSAYFVPDPDSPDTPDKPDTSSLPLLITTIDLPDGKVGTPYNETISAIGPTLATWALSNGALPDGLSLDTLGTISGTPTKTGVFTFTVKAEHGNKTAEKLFTIIVPFSEARSPSITTDTLTEGFTSSPYGFRLTAKGTAPITWSLAGGTLPDGLTLSETGYITGTPTTAGMSSITVKATNSVGNDTMALTLKISEAPSRTRPAVMTENPEPATQNVAYTCQLMALGTPPFMWKVKGRLPAGLNMDSSGFITGTPTRTANAKLTLTVSNDYGQETRSLTLPVHSLPEITTQPLKDATVGKKYNVTLSKKGTKPLVWELEGSLPQGIMMFDADNAKIMGTPLVNDKGIVRITLSNPVGEVSKLFRLNVYAPMPTVSPKTLSTGTYKKAYKMSFNAKSTTPLTIYLSGDLPAGLEFDESKATITGIPTEVCIDRPITVLAANMGGVTMQNYKLTIKGTPPKITTKALPDAVINREYSADIKAEGTPTINFTAVGLPEGLSISTDGRISGVPVKAGKFTVKIHARNDTKEVSKSCNLNVLEPPSFNGDATLTAGKEGKTYSHKFSVSGSKTITLSLSGGTLPRGITLKNGMLNGKPTEAGIFSFTVRATNSVGYADKTFSMTISNKAVKSVKSHPTDIWSNSYVREKEVPELTGTNGDVEMRQEVAALYDNTSDTTCTDTTCIMGEYSVVAVLPEVSVDVSGMYDFTVTLSADAKPGAKLLWLAGSSEMSDDDRISEFSDEEGKDIETVPENRRITVSVWLRKGVIYKPTVAVRH